jgi:flagellar basal body rod protein FlgC
MANLPPIMGAGFLHLSLLRGTRTYVSLDADTPFGIEIRFYSPTDELIDIVGTSYDNAPQCQLTLTEQKIGGVEKAKLKLSRNIEIPFYNQMEARVYIQGEWWFSTELTYKPDQDRRDPVFEYNMKGYSQYLKKVKLDELYENKTPFEILEDFWLNEVEPNTPLVWDEGQVDLPNINIVKLEINKKTAWQAMIKLLETVNTNFTNTQYEFGIDKYKHVYFRPLSNDLQGGYFEVYQYQEPDVESNIDKLINQIDIHRTQENSDTTEYVTSVQDTESQALYGLRQKDLLIPDYLDISDATRIATSQLERNKDPEISYQIENLPIEDEPFVMGKYALNSKRDEYSILISDAEQLSDWTQSVTNTTITQATDRVYTGKRSIKAVTANGSVNEYIEIELDNAVYFPDVFRFFVSQNPRGTAFNVILFDEDGNAVDIESIIRITEGSKVRITEDGRIRELEAGSTGIEIKIQGVFTEVRFRLSGVQNIKKLRIVFSTNDSFDIYFDRFETITNTYFQRQLFIDELDYLFTNNKAVANVQFGSKFPNLVDEVKEIKDEQSTIFGIFEKRV